MTGRWHFSKLLSTVALSFIALACTPNKKDSSVTIQMPGNSSHSQSNKLSQSVSALSSPFDSYCFMVNVTGGASASAKKNSCEVEKGITTKFVAAGSSATLTVPQGSGYRLQLIGYDTGVVGGTCPSLNATSDLEALDQTKIKELAVKDFDAAGEQTTVNLTAVIPAADLKTQYGLSSNCAVSSAAVLSVSDAGYSFGVAVTGTTATKIFTITQSGAASATSIVINGLAAPYSWDGGSYPGTGGTCGTTLGPSAFCTVVVNFSPTVSGSQNDAIDVSWYDGTSAQSTSRPIAGSGANPAALSISDGATYNFGSQTVGSSLSKIFTITNSGGYPANSLVINGLSAPYSWLGGSYPGTGGDCGTTLSSSSSCTVVVQYLPASTSVYNDAIDVAYNDGASAQTVQRPLTGNGLAPALLSISDGASYDYGVQATGSSTTKTFTITNSGASTATSMAGSGLTAPFTFVGGTYPGGGTCGATLASSATCTVVVQYSPASISVHTGSFTIGYSDGASATSVIRAVQGTGAAPASLSISDPNFNYGLLANGNNANKVFTITNSGGVAATAMSGSSLTTPFSWAGGTYPGSGGSCSATLAASGTCTVLVNFAPSVAGNFTETVSITYNDGASAGQTSSNSISGDSASSFTWTGGGGNSSWSNGGNWAGGIAPSTGDVAVFDGSCTVCNATIDSTISINGINLAASFSGNITVSASINITIFGNFEQYGGNFTGSNGNIQVNGLTKLYGGLFTAPTGTLAIGTALDIGPAGGHNHNGGKTKFSQNGSCGTTTITPGLANFWDVEFFASCSHTFVIQGSNLGVTNNLIMNAPGRIMGTTVVVMGNLFLNAAAEGGSATIRMANGAKTITSSAAGFLPSVDVGSTGNVTFSGQVGIRGNLISTGGWIRGAASSTMTFEPLQSCANPNLNLSGTQFVDLIFNNTCAGEAIFNLSGAANVFGNLHFAPSGNPIRLSGGWLYAENNVYNDSSGMMGGSAMIEMVGPNPQLLSGFAGAKFPSVNVQKSSTFDTVTLSGEVGIAESFTKSGMGIVSAGASTTVFYGLGASPQISLPSTLNNVIFKSGLGAINPILIGGNLNVSGSLDFNGNGGACLTIAGGDILAQGILTSNCNGAGGGGSAIVFNSGTTNQNWFINPGTVAPTKIIINNPGYSVFLATGTTYTAGDIYVQVGTLNLNGRTLAHDGEVRINAGATLTASGGALSAFGVGWVNNLGGTIN